MPPAGKKKSLMGALASGVKSFAGGKKKKSLKSLLGTSRQDPSLSRETSSPLHDRRRVRRPSRPPTPPRPEEEEEDKEDEEYEAEESEEDEGSDSDVSVVPEADSEEEEVGDEEFLELPPEGGIWRIDTTLDWDKPAVEYVETDPVILGCRAGQYNQRGSSSLPTLPYAHEKFILEPKGSRYAIGFVLSISAFHCVLTH